MEVKNELPVKFITNDIGIYQIVNLINGHKYIGSSKNLKNRYTSHSSALIANRHENSHLQRAFNKYGINNFKFECLCITTLNKKEELEQFYLNYFIDWKVDYNIRRTVSNQIKSERSFNVVNKPYIKLFKKLIKSNSLITRFIKEHNIKNYDSFRKKFNEYCRLNKIDKSPYYRDGYYEIKSNKYINLIIHNGEVYKDLLPIMDIDRKCFLKHFKKYCKENNLDCNHYRTRVYKDTKVIKDFLLSQMTLKQFVNNYNIHLSALTSIVKNYCKINNINYKKFIKNLLFKRRYNIDYTDFINLLQLELKNTSLVNFSEKFSFNIDMVKYHVKQNNIQYTYR